MSSSASGLTSCTAYASASAITSRPSASVLVTSVVRPPKWRITSPGRIAPPPTEFSASGISPVTRTGQSTSASAPITATTTPAPVMSRFIVIMLSRGLIDRPPVSNVMSLPTRTTCGVWRDAFLGS
jgi:hypothetical protein